MNRNIMAACAGLLMGCSGLFADLSQPWNNPSGGSLPTGCQHLTYHSAANDTTIGYIVYLPPNYDSSSAAATRYPVVYSLAPMEGDEWSNITLASTLQSNIASKAVIPMIMIFVNGRGNTFYADSKDGTVKCETTILKELIPHVDSLFRTVPDRAHRAVDGVSMGGFGAMMMAFKHYDVFGNVGTFIAALVDWDTLSTQTFDQTIPTKMFGSDSTYFNTNYYPFTFVKENADTLKALGMKVRMTDNSGDVTMGPLYSYNMAMESLLNSEGISVVFEAGGSGHSVILSASYAVDMLVFHSTYFSSATAVAAPAQLPATRSDAASCGRLSTMENFVIPSQWHALSRGVAVYSLSGRRLGIETIAGKTMLNGNSLAKRYGRGVLLVKPLTSGNEELAR